MELLARRDAEALGSPRWEALNAEKADYLESIKPSTRERIVHFWEKDLAGLGDGFVPVAGVFELPFFIERRSLLEYHPAQRHPIPYVLIRHGDDYFFILREAGGGELRLIGKKGLIGGHVDAQDVEPGDLERTIWRAALREAKEEAGLDEEMIVSVRLRGALKSDLGVDIDHLGLVYEIEVNTDRIKAEEDGVLTSIWIPRHQLADHYESFENWSKIVYDHLLGGGNPAAAEQTVS